MFTTTTNISGTTSTGASSTAVVSPTFSLINNSTTHSLVPSASSTNPSWRLTSPTVVSILNSSGVGSTMPTSGNLLYIASQTCPQPATLQSPQTVRLVSPSLTLINHSQTNFIGQASNLLTPTINPNLKSSICIDTPVLGRIESNSLIKDEQTSPIDNDQPTDDSEIELFVNNVVCSFAWGCKLNLRKIALEAANVIYKRDQTMLLMKIRNPYCSANIWSSGKVTVTGTTSEDDAQRGARRIARCLQRLGYKVKFRNYRVVNCLATCAMPWPIDIVKLSKIYPECVSYEPEIHPGATVRLNGKAVLKVFTTGRITLTAPSVERINTAVNDFYPQLFECRKLNPNSGAS